jgi:hypothetical protein
MIKYFFVLICFVLAQLIEQNDLFDKPKNWPAPFYDFEKNKLTKEKILLGYPATLHTGLPIRSKTRSLGS